jgi:hypothetical protein
MEHKKDQPIAFKAQHVPPISAANEKAALFKLKQLAEDNLHQYKDSYESDEERLKSSALSFNERNCLIFRSSEKRVSARSIGRSYSSTSGSPPRPSNVSTPKFRFPSTPSL